MKNELRVIIATNIRKYRKKMNMTQAQLAEQVGKTVEMISQIENNISSTKLSTLSAMAEVFGIEPYQLLMENEFQAYEKTSPELMDLLIALEEQPKEFLNALLVLVQQYKK